MAVTSGGHSKQLEGIPVSEMIGISANSLKICKNMDEFLSHRDVSKYVRVDGDLYVCKETGEVVLLGKQ